MEISFVDPGRHDTSPGRVWLRRVSSSSESRVARFQASPVSPLTLKRAQSLGRPLAATPKLSRPPEMWSSIATRFASSAGW